MELTKSSVCPTCGHNFFKVEKKLHKICFNLSLFLHFLYILNKKPPPSQAADFHKLYSVTHMQKSELYDFQEHLERGHPSFAGRYLVANLIRGPEQYEHDHYPEKPARELVIP